jgi:hypothetical protein
MRIHSINIIPFPDGTYGGTITADVVDMTVYEHGIPFKYSFIVDQEIPGYDAPVTIEVKNGIAVVDDSPTIFDIPSHEFDENNTYDEEQ